MCWYTMLEIPQLGIFGESCDNHANCLDIYGVNNKDPRADDSRPFSCAMYSFCPDHCCPMKHIWYMSECFQSNDSLCYRGTRPGSPLMLHVIFHFGIPLLKFACFSYKEMFPES